MCHKYVFFSFLKLSGDNNNVVVVIIKKTSVLPKPKSKAGRPTTNPNEKESETIALKITPDINLFTTT
jgi:hypothetical protein